MEYSGLIRLASELSLSSWFKKIVAPLAAKLQADQHKVVRVKPWLTVFMYSRLLPACEGCMHTWWRFVEFAACNDQQLQQTSDARTSLLRTSRLRAETHLEVGERHQACLRCAEQVLGELSMKLSLKQNYTYPTLCKMHHTIVATCSESRARGRVHA
jgi:hypothetical protein